MVLPLPLVNLLRADKHFVAITHEREPFSRLSALIGYVIAYLCVFGLITGLLLIKLGRIAIGKD